MPKHILILADGQPDYGADYLYDGLRTLAGPDGTVVDWPAKPSLHSPRDSGVFDCTLDWPPSPSAPTEAEVTARLAEGGFDLVVLPTLRGAVPQLVHAWDWRGVLDRVRDRIVAVDVEDHDLDCSTAFCQVLGASPAAHFKRELPLGATWAQPLPFGYPARRVIGQIEARAPRCIYAVHRWAPAWGDAREALAGALIAGLPPAELDLSLYRDGDPRPTPIANHARNRQALCGVAPRGAGWGTNRLLELVADGCAVVAEAATVEAPGLADAPWILWYRRPEEAVHHVRELLADPAYARTLAGQARAMLLRQHTTYHRAVTVWNAVQDRIDLDAPPRAEASAGGVQ